MTEFSGPEPDEGNASKIALVKSLLDKALDDQQRLLNQALFGDIVCSGWVSSQPMARRSWVVRQAQFLRQRLSDVVHVLRYGMPDDDY